MGIPPLAPLEMFTHEKQNLKFIRPFGSICYMHVDKHFRGKLDNKAIKCYLVGFEQLGYKLINCENGKR